MAAEGIYDHPQEILVRRGKGHTCLIGGTARSVVRFRAYSEALQVPTPPYRRYMSRGWPEDLVWGC